MHAAAKVLQKCLLGVIGMHAVRAQALIKIVQALLSSRRLVLMDLARACPGTDQVRAPLKCFDRLLSNVHLWAQCETLYSRMSQWTIRDRQPIILVDWSQLHVDCRQHVLRAAVAYRGRSITVLDMVFPESLKGSPIAERQFLQRLRRVLPAHVRPIIVTDAGFQIPWFKAVARLNWHYVGRMRQGTLLKMGSQPWFDNRQLMARASAKPQRFTCVKMARTNPWHADLVLYKKRPAGRQRLVRRGQLRRSPSRSNVSVKAQRRERLPWLLVASCDLHRLDAQRIVDIYALRMQIEQSFRDLKCDRLGSAFVYSLTRKPRRIELLLLIHTLASFVTHLATLCLHPEHSRRQYGGVSHPGRRWPGYSQFRIGWQALQRNDESCRFSALYRNFLHPPSWFIQLLSPST